MFPLEPIEIIVRGEEMTSDIGKQLWFGAHRQLAQSYNSNQRIISHKQFDEIDWPSVQSTIHNLSRLFQIWAAKHVNNIAGMMAFLSHQDGRSKLCLSVAQCPEEGCTLALEQSAKKMERWLKSNNTHLDIHNLLLWYLRGYGSILFTYYLCTVQTLTKLVAQI
jgi:hypothetical protein